MTEEEALAIIDEVARKLASKFRFGYYTREDILQEARLMALEGMRRYDPSRPLPNFLSRHVKNRLCNLLRDKMRRNDPPCGICHGGARCGNAERGAHTDEQGPPCKAYQAWRKRNDTKASLMQALSLGEGDDRGLEDGEGPGEVAELWAKVNEHLPVEHREDFLRYMDGLTLSRQRKARLFLAIRLAALGGEGLGEQGGEP